MARVFFINLHCNAFLLRPLPYMLVGRKSSFKHKMLLDWFEENNKPIYVYVNEKGTGFENILIKRWMLKYPLLRNVECLLTLFLNGISLKNIRITNRVEEIREDDIVLLYLFYPEDWLNINKMGGYKLVACNHIQGRIAPKHKIDLINGVFAESNIFNNSPIWNENYFFKDYSGDTFIMPYIPQDRFKYIIPFEKRKNKAVATGTLNFATRESEDATLQKIYHTKCLHPMRKEIYEHSEEVKECIDSKISMFHESTNKSKNLLIRAKQRFEDKHALQKKYYSMNMVDVYNQYKMAVVPEELVGLPAMGAFEAMACGCAYFGLDHYMYRDIGMIPGIHYVSYDGTLEHLVDRISYYQKHEIELEKIAENGRKYIENYLKKKYTSEAFWHQVYRASKAVQREK